MLIAVTLLTAGALACAVAPNLAAVVTGRILLAVGSGAAQATALATAAHLPASQRPAALARFGACLAVFSATAPLAGQWQWPGRGGWHSHCPCCPSPQSRCAGPSPPHDDTENRWTGSEWDCLRSSPPDSS